MDASAPNATNQLRSFFFSSAFQVRKRQMTMPHSLAPKVRTIIHVFSMHTLGQTLFFFFHAPIAIRHHMHFLTSTHCANSNTAAACTPLDVPYSFHSDWIRACAYSLFTIDNLRLPKSLSSLVYREADHIFELCVMGREPSAEQQDTANVNPI